MTSKASSHKPSNYVVHVLQHNKPLSAKGKHEYMHAFTTHYIAARYNIPHEEVIQAIQAVKGRHQLRKDGVM